MFTGRAGRPDIIDGGGDKPKVVNWEGRTISESKANEEEEEEEYIQELPEYKAGKKAPGVGSGQLDQIMNSISALAPSVSLLQVQVDRERQLPQQGARKAATLRQAPT